MAKKGEFALIDWIRRRSRFGADVVIGIGDDTAAVRPAKAALTLLTTDAVIEGTHFARGTSAFRIGWKAMAAAVSDIAAMAGVPRYALVAVALPDKLPMKWAQDVYKGLRAVADKFRVGIIGGNVASWKGGVSVTSTIVGECKGAPVPRGGAKIGDVIFVTGSVGGSLMGRHLRFLPRVNEALALRKAVKLHAMIDISDGLSRDLGHICEESGVGAALYESEIPLSPAARRAARKSGRTALEHALSDGEDYELLCTVSDEDAKRLAARPPFRSPRLTPIGVIIKRGMFLQHPDGRKSILKPKGYEHFT
jgi:thiamine-monophosphate kinase